MNDILRETIKLVPEQPGCYLYYNTDGEIIYVGKAKNLKRRVYSYFHKQHDSVKTTVLVSQIEKLEYIITDSEVEALILESHLIKKHKPRYMRIFLAFKLYEKRTLILIKAGFTVLIRMSGRCILLLIF